MEEKTIPKCPKHPNAPHDRQANHCVFCGTKLHDKPTCNHCGAIRDVRGDFCTQCGRRQGLADEDIPLDPT